MVRALRIGGTPVAAGSPPDARYGRIMKKLLILAVLVALGMVAQRKLKEL